MTLRFPLLALALAALPAATPALACSVGAPYRVPTNFELADGADAIVLGTVEGEESGGDSVLDKQVIVRPTLLLKGAELPTEVRMRGYLAKGGRAVTRSDPGELFRVNPDALSGGCNRYVFERGMQLVLFLERGETGALRVSLPPFARAAEDVAGPDAPWVKAVRLYVEIAALPANERRAALAARRDALRASADPDAVLLAADIDRQLGEKRLPPFD